MAKKKYKAISNFKPSDIDRTTDSTIITWKINRKIISDKILDGKTGQIQLRVDFYKKGRNPVTEFGYSYNMLLSNKRKYLSAKMVALRSAWGRVQFSPDGFSIVGEKYIYVGKIKNIDGVKTIE